MPDPTELVPLVKNFIACTAACIHPGPFSPYWKAKADLDSWIREYDAAEHVRGSAAIPPHCEGEQCWKCGEQATKKYEEPPPKHLHRKIHPKTWYLCDAHYEEAVAAEHVRAGKECHTTDHIVDVGKMVDTLTPREP